MKQSGFPSFRGRFLGVVVLVVLQLAVGIIHMFFGLVMLSGSLEVSFTSTPVVYSLYTLFYGCLTFTFAYLLWIDKRIGWFGTIAVSLFVIVADTLAVLDLFTGLGIPTTAALGEIPFSIVVIAYLIQSHVRTRYKP
jgi:hypothetical protein